MPTAIDTALARGRRHLAATLAFTTGNVVTFAQQGLDHIEASDDLHPNAALSRSIGDYGRQSDTE